MTKAKVLCLSNSMGLGHVTRDLAIMKVLRKHLPSVEITWLTAQPVTSVLDEAGEVLHPASTQMMSTSEIAEKFAQPGFKYDTRVGYQQGLAAPQHNAEVLAKVLSETKPDLVYGDEALEVLFLLLKNPKIKQWPLVWLTDSLTGSASPENVRMFIQSVLQLKNQIQPYTLLCLGTSEDVQDTQIGDGLPSLRTFFQQNFTPVGYIIPFDQEALLKEGKDRLKSRLGYLPDKKLVIASIGGTEIGKELLEKVDQAASALTAAANGRLDIVLVCGPRLSPNSIKATSKNVSVRGYVPCLYEHFAAADFAIIEGGLTSAIELAAVRTPFAYVPLTGHAEQETEVAPRLERLGVGKRLSFDELTPQNIANIFREALQNFNTSNLVSRQFNGADVTAEILQNFLLDESTLEI